LWLLLSAARKLCLLSGNQEDNSANQRHRACDGRQRYLMSLFARSVNRSDIYDLLASRVCKASLRQTKQAQGDEDDSECLVHSGLLHPM